MKIGIFPGSFNPVHKGHISLIKYLLQNKYVDKIIVIATGNYWDKNDLLNLESRLNMLNFYSNEKIIINNTLNNYPYTYQIMRKLKKEYPQDSLSLIIGSDNFETFSLWKNYQELLKYEILIVPREGYNINEYPKNVKLITNYLPNSFSSTIIRNLIKNNEYKSLTKYLDNEIILYIKNNNLYQ